MKIQYDLKIYNGTPQVDYQITTHITVFSVLEGKASFKFEEDKVELRKGELYVMNFGKLYRIHANADTVIAELKINYDELSKSAGKKGLKFNCDTLRDVSKSHYQLKKAFSQFLRLYVIGDRKFEEWSYFYKFLSILMNEYIRYSIDDGKGLEENRMNQVRLYLHTHYKEKITLEDLCSRFYLSTSTLVRNFKRQNNKSIIQYLNEIRIQAAKQLLLEKENSVTYVAMEVGFSDSAMFIKTFKKITGISPLKFKQKIETRDNQIIENQELIKMVEKTFLIESANSHGDSGRNVYRKNEIYHYNDMIFDKPIIQAVGVQDSNVLLNSQYQQSLLQMHKLMGLKYVRIPFILSKEMISENKDQDVSYDFSKVDIILDFILENKMIPIIELSGRRKIVRSHDVMLGLEEVSEYSYSDKVYKSLVTFFIKHVYYRFAGDYGRLAEWIWEFQYERNKYTLEDYVSKFNDFSNEVHKWGKNHRFGGYGIDIYNWDEKEIAELAKYSFLPDFISVNIYPYRCKLKEGGLYYLEQSVDPFYLQNEMTKLKNILDSTYGLSEIPLYVTQWDTSLEDCNVVNDSYVKASMATTMVANLMGLADLFVYDELQDIKSTGLKNEIVLFGGRGLFSKDGVKKPVFNAMAGLSCLGQKMMLCSDNLFFSSLRMNHLVGICLNQKSFNMSYYQKPEKNIKEEDINYFYDDQDILEQEICISDIANGIYRIRLAIISEERSILTQLRKMCNHIYLDVEDLQFLRRENSFDIQLIEKKTNKGCLEFSITVKPNEMVLINVFPVQLDD